MMPTNVKTPDHGAAFRKLQGELQSKKPASAMPPRGKDGKFKPRGRK